MKNIFLLLALAFLLIGCGSTDSDDYDVVNRRAQSVVLDPYEYNPRQELALFVLDQEQRYVNGRPNGSDTRLYITNTSGLTATFNFVVSGPGWRYESAVYQLPPNVTVSLGVITNHFNSLDNFWITIPDVIYNMTSNA